MKFEQDINKFMDSHFYDEDTGNLNFTLPINTHQYVEEKSREFAGVSRMLDDDDIEENWGSFGSFYHWKTQIVTQAREINTNYLLGRLHALISIYNDYQLTVLNKSVEDLPKLDTNEYIKTIFESVYNTDSE